MTSGETNCFAADQWINVIYDMDVRKRQTFAAGGLLQPQLTDATLGIVRDPEAPGYASVQPRQLAECRRCLAVGLLERGTEVAVAREAECQCQVGDVVVVAQQV
jgi:hypothetical protein